jgi:hypothetical protein
MAAGNLYIRLLDEGIYLEGATRILRGQVPYRDFFVLTGPACFWMVAGLFQVFGTQLWAARLLPAAELSLVTAAVFWLVSRSASRAFALLAALAYLGLAAVSTDMMVVNHRLDSAALAVLAATAAVAGFPLAAGALAAWAAWATPPMLVVSLALLGFHRTTWRRFVAGMAMASVPAAGWLLWKGGLVPMVTHLAWSVSNYAGANGVGYGSVVGGWGELFGGASGFELVNLVVFAGYCLMLPVALPLVVPVSLVFRAWSKREEYMLVAAAAAMLISTYPRPNTTNLRYICPLFLVLAATLLYRFRYWPPVMAGVGFLSVVLLLFAGMNIGKGERLATPRGTIRIKPAEAATLKMLLHHVRPGDKLFVYPYEPITTFLTGGLNPTRYSFLQPGMMTDFDQLAALAGLKADPPRWIYYCDVPAGAYLRIWPGSDPRRLRMPLIEQHLRAHYEEAERVSANGLPVQLLRLKPGKMVEVAGAVP